MFIQRSSRQRVHAVERSISLVTVFLLIGFSSSYELEWPAPHHNQHGLRPEVTRRAIAGLWRLTPKAKQQKKIFPMKEFTVYPIKKKEKITTTLKQQDVLQEPELLLMLKEDGSFQQYAKDNDEEEDDDDKKAVDADASWQKFSQQRRAIQKNKLVDLVKGIWDYRDGNLILAADRPDEKAILEREKQHQDTLLVGRVVATYGDSLKENPAVPANDEDEDDKEVSSTKATTGSTASSSSSKKKDPASTSSAKITSTNKKNSNKQDVDAHLSVPKGSLNVGKFFYPKNHPSFFDQPIYNPERHGSFQLRQVLGSLNTRSSSSSSSSSTSPEQQVTPQFERSHFYNKTFWLTSHPIGRRRPKGNLRWSIKYNKYVHDPPKKKKKQEEEEDANRPVPIRVMQVLFFPNNTFSTVAGMGDAAILRGKFDVTGQDRDHLWMQVMRFGFGRSVSGSVYSEGRMLTQDDAKTYWGKITETNSTMTTTTTTNTMPSSDAATSESGAKEAATAGQNTTASTTSRDDNNGDELREGEGDMTNKLEVQGSVMLGWGLEPLPVARFIMKELEQLDDDDVDVEEDEDDDDEEDATSNLSSSLSASEEVEDDGIDWSNDEGFQ